MFSGKSTIKSICPLMNSLSLDISLVFAWNVCGLSLSILRCDLCLTNRTKSFLLSNSQEASESISISGKLEKNQIKKSVAYLQKLFHSISHIQRITVVSPTSRFAYESFHLLSVRLRLVSIRLRPICQLANVLNSVLLVLICTWFGESAKQQLSEFLRNFLPKSRNILKPKAVS